MLDHCCILTQGGIVLWSKSFTGRDASEGAPFIDQVIRTSLIEQSPDSSTSTVSGNLQVKYTLDNLHGLVFAVAYPRILTLAYIPTLLSTIKTLFLSLFGPIVENIVQLTTGLKDPDTLPAALKQKLLSRNGWHGLWKGWEEAFMDVCRELEKQPRQAPRVSSANHNKSNASAAAAVATQEKVATAPTNGPTDPVADSELIARNVHAFRARQKAAKGNKKGRVVSGVASGTEVSGSDTDSTTASAAAAAGKSGKPKKSMRKWDENGAATTQDDAEQLDFSVGSLAEAQAKDMVDTKSMGQRGRDGIYEVADYQAATFEDDDDEEEVDYSMTTTTSAPSAFSSFLNKVSSSVGLSARNLSAEDLQPVLNKMSSQLMEKNVARDVAESIIASVRTSLLGVSVRGPGSSGLNKAVRQALSESLTRILTPRTPTDILLDIQRKKEPYAITFVGVNGVGKSTNLSKVAFWLLQNHCKVLIAACDTFRSGAVEQLRVHVRNLRGLNEAGVDGKDKVELYEKGYGKDAAGIARDALAYAKEEGFDVVLIDTAGRMQDNEPLMRALAKLVTVNKPDKIVFVGEALVGNEAVDQLSKFHNSLRQFSSASGSPRGIDGIILTKFDTIDDKVGAAVSMTFVTGQPLLFVGTGQTYSDLRSLRVEHIVRALLA